MKSQIRKCPRCGRYTIYDECPLCSSKTVSTVPARFSPEDPYGKYRRAAIKQEYGENGKYRKI